MRAIVDSQETRPTRRTNPFKLQYIRRPLDITAILPIHCSSDRVNYHKWTRRLERSCEREELENLPPPLGMWLAIGRGLNVIYLVIFLSCHLSLMSFISRVVLSSNRVGIKHQNARFASTPPRNRLRKRTASFLSSGPKGSHPCWASVTTLKPAREIAQRLKWGFESCH